MVFARRGATLAVGLALALTPLDAANAQESKAPAALAPQAPEQAREPAEEESGIVRTAPAELLVVAVAGARVTVDGTVVGSTPFPRALKLEPGRHRIEVAANGFEPASREVMLTSGRTTALAIDLEATSQRSLAWVFVASGAAGIAAGIGLGVVSVVQHRRAQDLPGDGEDGNAREEVQAEYDAAIAARDDFRVGSGLGAGLGLGLFLVGGLLFTFDEPSASSGSLETRGVAREAGAARWQLRATPMAGPDLAGGLATLRF